MKTGVILLFTDNEKEIKENDFNKLIDKDAANFCFVNNASKDKTLDKLNQIKSDTHKNISILDIKKNKGLQAAIKAGVRYLKNNQDFNSIVYFEFSKHKKYENLEHIFNVTIHKKNILNFISTSSQRNILKNVFSLDQVVK